MIQPFTHPFTMPFTRPYAGDVARLWDFDNLPDQIANYDGSAQTVAPGGEDLAAFTDQFGNGNHATQIIGSAQPRIGDDKLGGLNVVTYNGASDYLDVPPAVYGLSAADSTVFVLVEPDSPATDHRVFSIGPGGSRYYIRIFDNFVWFRCGASFSNSIMASLPSGPAIISAGLDGTTQWLRVNGGVTVSNGLGGYITSTNGTIGSSATGGGQFFLGKQAQLSFHNAALSLENIQKAEGRLSDKWGVPIDPAHPYFENPPTV